MTEEQSRVHEFAPGGKLLQLGDCVVKALEGALSAMACCLTATLCSVSCSLVLPGLVHKPIALGRAVTSPQEGFSSTLIPLMVSLLLTLDQKVLNPADPGRACKGHTIRERFRSAQICKLLSSSCLHFLFSCLFSLTPFNSLCRLLSPGVPVLQKKEEKNVFTK